jgi:hypothetical protein
MEDEDSRTAALRSEVERLGDLEAPASLWEGIERALPTQRSQFSAPRWAFATAVGVVLVAAAWVFFQPHSDPRAELMQRSRELETRMATIAPRGSWSDTSRVLVYRISDVDRALDRLSIEGGSPPAEAELLQRRVDLMESLVALERQREPELVRTIAY